MELCHYLYPPLDKNNFLGFFRLDISNLSINQFPNKEPNEGKIKFETFLYAEVKNMEITLAPSWIKALRL